MKIAISGKGGVGKTSLAACLAMRFASDGKQVLAIDADPDANLAQALGIDPSVEVVPIGAMKEVVEERVGPEGGGMFRLNPLVEDLPDSLSIRIGGVRFMAMGTPPGGGSRCMCREHSLLRSLLDHILTDRDEAVVVDMEAGVEHLGRGTARGVDALIVVVDADPVSMGTARRIQKLAADIGLSRTYVVFNKVRDEEGAGVVASLAAGMLVLGTVPFIEELARGLQPPIQCSRFVEAVERVKASLYAAVGDQDRPAVEEVEK